LAARPGELIDRERQIHFTFDGKPFTAHPGDTIASALAAANVSVFSRSFKYHRPRGLLCCAGHCPNCLVQVGAEPNVRACLRPVEPSMAVQSQNAWPSLRLDAMALTSLADRFLPPGFYYKAFVHPQALWPAYEKVLRSVAGLGRVEPDTPPGEYEKIYLHADVAVVGGGPAGLTAALAAAAAGLSVLVIDENSTLGGHLRYDAEAHRASLEELTRIVAESENIRVLPNTTVFAAFEENWLAAIESNVAESRVYKIRAASVIYATGAYEQPALFGNNDLPGIMLGGAAQRLIRLYGVRPGHRAIVVTANDDGWTAAAELLSAGIEVAAVVDARPSSSDEALIRPVLARNVPIYWAHAPVSARGSTRVESLEFAPLAADGRADLSSSVRSACDLVVVSVGWSPANGLIYQAGGRMAYDPNAAEFTPTELPAGVFAAGRVAGAHELRDEVTEGKRAGDRAAAYLGSTPASDSLASIVPEATVTAPKPRTFSPAQAAGGGKRIVCYCEDVSDKDIELSIAEGYDSIELLKRYSTISMGPCQGKMCSQNTLHLCARATGRRVEEIGTTTSRPPITPVSLGALAGRHMEPVQVSPIHAWHLEKGAKMLLAGLWVRPEHYGDPLEEVRAVRNGVGIIDVSTLGKFKLTGPGVPTLLDRLYVNKWGGLGVGRARYGLMCNDEGIILDDGVTARIAEREWYMTTTSTGSGAVFEWIQWWLQSGWGDGIQAVNLSEVYAAFNLAGPHSREVLSRVTDADLGNEGFPYMTIREANVAGVPCRLLRIGFTGELSYEIHCPAGYGRHVWEELLAAGGNFGIRPFGVEAQRILRLEKAHIIIGQDTDGLTDPLSADLEGLVKLDKPDFLGHRAISRIGRDSPKQRLVGFVMDEPHITPDEGLQIVRTGPDGRHEIIGWVTSSRYSPTLKQSIGLCWLPEEVARLSGATFTIRMNGHLETARVHHGPFYDPQGHRLRG
jgi:sarcosine oxidase subunit alpha